MTNAMNTDPMDNMIEALVTYGDSLTPARSGLDIIMGTGCGDDALDAKVNELAMTHLGCTLTDSLVDDIVDAIDVNGDLFND